MIRTVVVVVVSLALAPAALAGPFKERLTKDQVAAAIKAVQDRLTVDKAAAEKCAKLPTETTADRAAAATCLRGSGSLGAAIMLWKAVVTQDPKSPLRVDATRELGPAYEAAAIYAEAAKWYVEYAKRFPDRTDARERLIRAVCIYRQLDYATEATAGYKLAVKQFKLKTKADALCDQLRPIVVPAQP